MVRGFVVDLFLSRRAGQPAAGPVQPNRMHSRDVHQDDEGSARKRREDDAEEKESGEERNAKRRHVQVNKISCWYPSPHESDEGDLDEYDMEWATDDLTGKCIDIDNQGRIRLSRKAALNDAAAEAGE